MTSADKKNAVSRLTKILFFFKVYPRYLESQGFKAYFKNSWNGLLSGFCYYYYYYYY